MDKQKWIRLAVVLSVVVINLFCCIDPSEAVLLGEVGRRYQGGWRAITPLSQGIRVEFLHSHWDENHPPFYDPIQWDIAEEDIGKTFYASAATHSSFADCVYRLTNGIDDQLYVQFYLLSSPDSPFCTGSLESASWSKKYGMAGVDFSGCVIESIALTVNDCWVQIPGRNLNHDGVWTDFGFDATISIYGVPPVPPIAEAGDDIIGDANEVVILDANNSSDPDGQIIKYTWKRLPDGVVIYSGPEPTCQTRALGRVEEVIELTVTDDSLATATDTLKIISRTTQQLKDQLAALQSQIEQLHQQQQETRSLVDRICSYPPITWWLRRVAKLGDLNGDGEVDMSDFALFTKGWLH
ncbi:MAG: PKD domain-containing protein [candidate division Zixibacteria bacterium]|nr:PKD domain-containing protein [candidate division Zixibacteria bacterium]